MRMLHHCGLPASDIDFIHCGGRVMNEVTRLVVVSWGKASKEKKEKTADSLGLERGG